MYLDSDRNKSSHHLSHDLIQCLQETPHSTANTLLQEKGMDLNDLPDDVIYMIFQYLSPNHLCNLRCVSKRLLFLASKDAAWLPHAKSCGILKGFNRQCSAMELCKVASRWNKGQAKQAFIARQKKRQIPWICKGESSLWLSRSSCIHYFHCQSSGWVVEDRTRCLQGGSEDLTCFVVKDNIAVSGCRDGSVCWWEISDVDSCPMSSNQIHKSDTHCVDFTDSLIVSGSRDTTCKVLRFDRSSNTPNSVVLNTFEAGERVWSLKISPGKEMFAAGLAGCLDDPPLVLWDLESGCCIAQLSVNHKRGAGVLDLRFESPNELLTCGYDTFIRLWDLRTHTCVRQWEEPFDSALYCIETDGEDTMVVGTAHHGMIRLWDKRHSDPVQMMYCKNSRSPVYSLAMDYGHLYLALDTGLAIMDFT